MRDKPLDPPSSLMFSLSRISWWSVSLARGTVCYVGVTIPEEEGVNLEENLCPTSLTPLCCELDWSMQSLHEFTTGREGRWHTAGEVWYLRFCFKLFFCFPGAHATDSLVAGNRPFRETSFRESKPTASLLDCSSVLLVNWNQNYKSFS